MLKIKKKTTDFFECLPSYEQNYFKVDHDHQIYFEQYGNPNGKPILFLHGGPGAGFSASHKSFFNPKIFRVIFFDQRGAGKSIPFAETKNNNTKNLINDIEKLRVFLDIDQWYLFGGSWGSTLALLYGISFPKRCLGFVLRGIFLGTRNEVNWFLYDIKKFFPEAHNKLMSFVPKKYHSNVLKWFYEQLHINNRSINLKAASVWAEYENSCSTLRYVERPVSGESALAISRIETHYFINNCFLSENFIYKNIYKICNIPSLIIQGRHDVICPPNNAFILSKSWKASKLEIVEDAGHSAFEQSMRIKLIDALKKIL